MKTQAWGWLTAAVLAAGLNSSYHNGGLQWAHEIADRVQHNSNAVLALATGRADRFLAEARIVKAQRQEKYPLAAALSQSSFDQQEWQFDRLQMTERQQAQLARFEANRARVEAQVQAKLDRLKFAEARVNPVVVQIPKIDCQRMRVNIPRIQRFRVPAPVVHLKYAEPGPV